MLISNPLKKLKKMENNYKQTSLMNLSKSGKSAYFRHVFAKNLFNGFEISVKFCAF